jgi:hypothetical protein
MNVQPYNQPQTHPKGHYSAIFLTGPSGRAIDALSFRSREGKEVLTTHQKIFNAAFRQERGPDYYNGMDSYGFEAGSFRLAGWWLPYKSAPEEQPQ